MNDDTKTIEFQDAIASKTGEFKNQILVSPDRPVKRATWTEFNSRDASVQLYFEGFEEEEKELEKIEAPNVEDGSAEPDGAVEDGEKVPKKPHSSKQQTFQRITGVGIQDEEKFKTFLNICYGITLESEPYNVRGMNFGSLIVSMGKCAVALTDCEKDTQETMEIPLANVSQIALPGKNEVEIQYGVTEQVSLANGLDSFELSVVRFFIPPGTDDNGEEVDVAESWQRKMKAVADAYDEGESGGAGIIFSLDEDYGDFLAPRAKYRVELYKESFRMRGKTYDFKVPYANIVQMHLLENADGITKSLVISLKTPLRAGQQRYPHVVWQIPDTEDTITSEMSDERLEELFGRETTLKHESTGRLPELLGKMFKTLSEKKVFVMPSVEGLGFFSKPSEADGQKHRCLSCHFKTAPGTLFPMKSALLFLTRPVMYVKFDNIDGIEFRKSSHVAFDLVVSLKDNHSTGLPNMLEFSLIDKKQFETTLKHFANNTQVKIANRKILMGNPSAFFAAPMKEKGAFTEPKDEDEGEDEDSSEDSNYDPEEAEREKEVKRENKEKQRSEREQTREQAIARGESVPEEGESSSTSGSEESGSSDSDDSDGSDSDMAEEVPMDEDEVDHAEIVEGKRKQSKSSEGPAIKKLKPSAESFIARESENEDGEEEDDGKKKKKKDPNAPKRPKTSFVFFMEKERAAVATPGKPFGDIQKELGEMWKLVGDKHEFEKSAADDKARFEREMKTYVPKEGVEPDSKKSSKKSKSGAAAAEAKKPAAKDPKAPKHPKTAFNFFSEFHRPALKAEGLEFGQIATRVGEMWKVASAEEKSKSTELAVEDKKRYEEEMKTYVPPAGFEKIAKTKAIKNTKAPSTSGSAGLKKKKKHPAGAGLGTGSSESSSEDDSSPDDDSGAE